MRGKRHISTSSDITYLERQIIRRFGGWLGEVAVPPEGRLVLLGPMSDSGDEHLGAAGAEHRLIMSWPSTLPRPWPFVDFQKLTSQKLNMSLPKLDVEASNIRLEFLEGYKDFSEFIGSDSQFFIYRQFSSLGARNLLYLEAEIQLLEFQIKALDDADIQVLKQTENNDEKKHVDDAARAWELFQKQAKEGDERSTAKLALVYKLRELRKIMVRITQYNLYGN
jgi:hypothetical protein